MGSFKSLYILTLLSTFFHVMMQYQAPSNLGILGHAYNLSTQEAEAVKSRVSVHLGLHIKILSQKQNKQSTRTKPQGVIRHELINILILVFHASRAMSNKLFVGYKLCSITHFCDRNLKD